jgi:nucleotide-binding universal stress UspA family protein
MYHRILLAYDGTVEGRRALLTSDELAAFSNAELHLLAVASMPSTMFLTEGFVPDELIDTEKKRMQAVLDEGIARVKERRGILNVTGHLAVGEPVEEIGRLAKSLDVDLIVVGHRQHTSIAKRWWAGSVSKSLVDHAPCSVLIVVTA